MGKSRGNGLSPNIHHLHNFNFSLLTTNYHLISKLRKNGLWTYSIKRGKTYSDVINHLGEVLPSLGELVYGNDDDLMVKY